MKDECVDRYKSRLFMDSSKQVSGIDYKDNFAPADIIPLYACFLRNRTRLHFQG